MDLEHWLSFLKHMFLLLHRTGPQCLTSSLIVHRVGVSNNFLSCIDLLFVCIDSFSTYVSQNIIYEDIYGHKSSPPMMVSS